jgi:hypothetical protein
MHRAMGICWVAMSITLPCPEAGSQASDELDAVQLGERGVMLASPVKAVQIGFLSPVMTARELRPRTIYLFRGGPQIPPTVDLTRGEGARAHGLLHRQRGTLGGYAAAGRGRRRHERRRHR